MEVFAAVFPIVLLIFLMTKRNPLPSSRALPLSAFVVYVSMLLVFQRNPTLVHAEVLNGLLVAWTPITIIAGAIFLFKTMDATGGLAVIRTWLNTVSQHQVAQLMIVGWAFPFLIEGASGFGTPAALAAPILVGLGFPPARVAILCLIMNSVPVSFGAVGTPTWFGFSAIDLTQEELLSIGFKSALLNSVAAFAIPAFALMFVLKPRTIFENTFFILPSILVTVIPYTLIAAMNVEFPSLIGGTIGLVGTVFMAKKGWGLSKRPTHLQESVTTSTLPVKEVETTPSENEMGLLKASFPLWGTILLLVITRIPQLGIKPLLLAQEPALSLGLGFLGEFKMSVAGVLGLSSIFGTEVNFQHALLYVPSLIPFGLVSLLAFAWCGTERTVMQGVWQRTVRQMRAPVCALLGALVFVRLMMMGGDRSAVTLIGNQLADLTGDSWTFFASYLGALGSFFSGSATISNLTFGSIQNELALKLNLDRTTILAMQSVGGAMGNMVCVNNIVAVASVLGLQNQEGFILKRTVWSMMVYGVLVGVVAILLF